MFTREIIDEKMFRKTSRIVCNAQRRGKDVMWCIKLIIIHTSLKIHDKITERRKRDPHGAFLFKV